NSQKEPFGKSSGLVDFRRFECVDHIASSATFTVTNLLDNHLN
ncbi:hypothetical protein M5D96_003248, partial [Drosophila gunungcola]